MKNDTPQHPKILDLARTLDINQAWAVGIMEMLWHWAADYVQQGDIGKYANQHIAKAVAWPGDPNQLIDALIHCRWLDESEEHRLIIHDWSHHCDRGVNSWLATRRLSFADGRRPSLTNFTESERDVIHADYDEGITHPGERRFDYDTQNPAFPEYWAQFWKLWPRKNNKQPALRVWCRVVKSEEMAKIILAGVRMHSQPGGALANPEARFIPYAVTWLNRRGWEDEYAPSSQDLENHVLERDPTLEDLLAEELAI